MVLPTNPPAHISKQINISRHIFWATEAEKCWICLLVLMSYHFGKEGRKMSTTSFVSNDLSSLFAPVPVSVSVYATLLSIALVSATVFDVALFPPHNWLSSPLCPSVSSSLVSRLILRCYVVYHSNVLPRPSTSMVDLWHKRGPIYYLGFMWGVPIPSRT